MSDALRVFKANAAAAAAPAAGQGDAAWPPAGGVPPAQQGSRGRGSHPDRLAAGRDCFRAVRYRGLFRPSSVIAGDTYNVVRAGTGSGFFQVDVAGHGAPAALISVASHHTLSQALLKQAERRATRGRRGPDQPRLAGGPALLHDDPRRDRRPVAPRRDRAGRPSARRFSCDRDGTRPAPRRWRLPDRAVPAAHLRVARFEFGPGPPCPLFRRAGRCPDPVASSFSEERLLDLVRRRAGASTRPSSTHLDAAVRRLARIRHPGRRLERSGSGTLRSGSRA